jgi:conjugative transfer region protein (TIGR03750 family)
MQQEDDGLLLAERLNREPVVMLGYTDSELLFAIKLACAIAFPSGLTVGFAIGKPMPGFGTGFLLMIALVALGGKALQRLKRGRPDYYYQMRLKLFLGRHGLAHCGLFRHRGRMGLGRTRFHRY